MTDLKLGIVFDVKNGKFKSEVKESAQVFSQLGNSAQKTSSQTRQFNKTIDDTNTKLFKTNKVAASVKNAIAGMAAGYGAIQLGKGLVTELAAFQDIRTRLQGLSQDATDYANKERWLIDLATEHHKELNGLADGYSRLSTLTQEKVITDGQARNMLEGLSNAAAQNGASTADLERVYYGLAQALGQGVVQMQEVNQVVEPLPGLMTKLARAAGEETGAGFKALIASGKVTSEVFGGLLVTALKEYEGAAAKTADNINAKYRDIKREYQLLAVELEQPINGALLPTLDGLAEGLSFLKDHAEGIVTVLQGGLVLAAGHAAKAISAKTAATAESIIVDYKKAQAAAIAAKSDEVLAVSANKRAIQEQAAAKRSLANASNTVLRTRAIKNLAIANGQVAASEKALAITTNNLTVATKKLSLVRKSMSLMSGLVGGLPGLLTIAAFSMYSFASSALVADENTKGLTRSIEEALGKQKELATQALQTDVDERMTRLAQLQQKIADIHTKLAVGHNQKLGLFDKGVVADSIEEAKKLGAEITQLNAKILSLSGDKDPKKKTKKIGTQDPKVLDAFKDQEAALKRQLGLLGKTTELAKAEYETQLGKYKDLLPGQKATIVNLAKEVDVKKASIAADKQSIQQASQLSDTANSYAETLQRKISLTGAVSNVQQLNYELEHGSLVGINELLKEQLMIKAQLADQAVADAEKQLPFWEQMQEHIASTTQNFDTMWGNSFDRFAQGIGDATATSIMEGQNFGDAMKNIGKSAIKEVISGIVQIGVKKLALYAIEKIINKGAAVSGGGVMLAEAQASSLAAGIHAFKSTAAIPVFGPALAPGAMTAALAITSPMVAGVAGMVGTMTGMAHDGIDEIPREGTWLLDKGERVVDSRTNSDLKNALNKGEVGGEGGISVVVHNTFEGNASKGDFDDDFFDRQREAIYSAVSQAKADRGEDF